MANIKPLQLKTDSEADLSETSSKISGKKKKKKVLNRLLLIILIILLVGTFFWKNSSTSSVFRYVIGQGSSLQVENGRINVLLLGMAGGQHDGSFLTDTIMVASFDTKTNTVNLISLPRDLWWETAKSKVNSLYEKKLAEGNGLKYAEENFGLILGIKIPYAVRMDFSGFTKAVDLVGGIDVNIANSFDDYLYPIEGKETDYCGFEEKDMDLSEDQAKKLNLEKGIHQVLIDKDGNIATASAIVGGKIEYIEIDENKIAQLFHCRYEHISFKKGLTHMDGTTALKFVRSRHGLPLSEGSDFARSRRQQLVLQTFKQKVLSAQTLTDINKITGLLKTFGDSVETDIPESQYLEFAGLIKQVKVVRTTVISSEGKNPLLIHPLVGDYDGAWVLIPPNNDFAAVHNYLSDFINQTDTATQSALPLTPKP